MKIWIVFVLKQSVLQRIPRRRAAACPPTYLDSLPLLRRFRYTTAPIHNKMVAPINATAIPVVLLLASPSLSFSTSATSSLISVSAAVGSVYRDVNAGGGVTGVRVYSGDWAGEGSGEGAGDGILEAARYDLEIRRRKRNEMSWRGLRDAAAGELSIAFMATADEQRRLNLLPEKCNTWAELNSKAALMHRSSHNTVEAFRSSY